MKKDFPAVIFIVFFAIILFVQLPNIFVYVLFSINLAALVMVGIICLIQKIKNNQLFWVPRFVFFWSLYTVCVVISMTRNILTAEIEEKINLSPLILTSDYSNKNLILSTLIFLCFTTIGLLVLDKGKERLSENWENVKAHGDKELIELYGNTDCSLKVLRGIFKFLLSVTFIIFWGRVLIENLKFNIQMTISIRENLLLAMDISIIFQSLIILCYFICSCSVPYITKNE